MFITVIPNSNCIGQSWSWPGETDSLYVVNKDFPRFSTARQTVKRLVYQGKNKMQLRGLLMLLLSRAAGHCEGAGEVDPNTGVSERQRKLAEIVEMIHTGQAIHQVKITTHHYPVNSLS